jgi:hypothetical protein
VRIAAEAQRVKGVGRLHDLAAADVLDHFDGIDLRADPCGRHRQLLGNEARVEAGIHQTDAALGARSL